MSDFDELLAPYLAERGGKTRLAAALGMTPSGLGRGIQARTLSIENLLMLAKHIGRPASEVLRAAGKAEVADLIEDLYGEGRPPLGGAKAELLSLFEQLPAAMQEAALAWMRASADAVHPPSHAKQKRAVG